MVAIHAACALAFLLIAQSQETTCHSDWEKILQYKTQALDSSDFSLMFQYSGFSLNDLGDFKSCNSLDSAKYALISYSASPTVVQTFCGPKSCTESDYLESFLIIPDKVTSNLKILFPSEYQEANYGSLSGSGALMIVLILTLLILVSFAGFLDLTITEEQKQDEVIKALLCFSFVSNGKKLFEPLQLNKAGMVDPMNSISGVRVLSIAWIVLGHTCQYFYMAPALSNYETAFENTRNLFFVVAYGGFYAVDTFFLAAGFIVTYHSIHDLQEKKSTSTPGTLIEIFFHRYLLLTPNFIFALFFFWTLQKYLGSGPLWFNVENSMADCDEYWMTNLLYVNNFIPDFKGNTCFVAGWYIACDLQFLIICSFITAIYVKSSKFLGWLTIPIVIVGGLVSCALVGYYENLNSSFFAASNESRYFLYYYTKPYCRMAPYILGVACAFIGQTYRKYNITGSVIDRFSYLIIRFYKSFPLRLCSIVIGVLMLDGLMLIAYDNYQEPGQDNMYLHWSQTENLIFIAFERLAASVAIMLILLPVWLGFFKPIRLILSSYPFILFAKLNFCVFLMHSNVLEILFRSRPHAIEFSVYHCLGYSVLVFFLCQAMAVPMVLCVEMPVMNLKSYFIGRQAHKMKELMLTSPFMVKLNKNH